MRLEVKFLVFVTLEIKCTWNRPPLLPYITDYGVSSAFVIIALLTLLIKVNKYCQVLWRFCMTLNTTMVCLSMKMSKLDLAFLSWEPR